MQTLKILVFLTIIATLSSCNTDSPELVSRWRLIEQLADPGNGSGEFVSVVSQKEIELFDDGTFCSNGSICTMDISTTDPSSGTYDDETMIIEVDDCNLGHFPRTYEVSGDTLIINYPCIEPCREKFVRTE